MAIGQIYTISKEVRLGIWANNVILTDIYAAREIDDGTVSSRQLVDAINERIKKNSKGFLYV